MRLKRMYSFQRQLRYLHAFDVIMRHLFRKAGFDDTLQKLRFYAHIYYRGSLLKQGKANDSAFDLTSSSTKTGRPTVRCNSISTKQGMDLDNLPLRRRMALIDHLL